MGFEVVLNAFPPQCGLLERVRAWELSGRCFRRIGECPNFCCWEFGSRDTASDEQNQAKQTQSPCGRHECADQLRSLDNRRS
jgi:hypothetical protein